MFFNIKTIRKSVLDKFGKESSTRIQGYYLLYIILAYGYVLLGLEVFTAIFTLLNDTTNTFVYHPSAQIIIVLSSLMAHHLAVLFNKRKEYKSNEPITALTNDMLLDEENNKQEKKVEKVEKEINIPVVKNTISDNLG